MPTLHRFFRLGVPTFASLQTQNVTKIRCIINLAAAEEVEVRREAEEGHRGPVAVDPLREDVVDRVALAGNVPWCGVPVASLCVNEYTVQYRYCLRVIDLWWRYVCLLACLMVILSTPQVGDNV